MFLEAGGDAAELLELAEEAFDQVATAIEVGRHAALQAHTALGRNVGHAAPRGYPLDQRQAVVSAIGNHGAGRQRVAQDRGYRLVGGLARRDVETDRQPILINDGMDLGAQSATRTADGVILAPLFPPAACWWARTMELSITCKDCGERCASSSNTFSQMPRLAQRLNRLYTVV